jgi:assimilatory nitrate reductase catalytic subunit
VLGKLYPKDPYIEIHPHDAEMIGVRNGELVHIRSRRGEALATVCVSPTVQQGQAFMPMHYEATNKLTLRSFDPHSRQPSYKYCAVAITAAEGAAT